MADYNGPFKETVTKLSYRIALPCNLNELQKMVERVQMEIKAQYSYGDGRIADDARGEVHYIPEDNELAISTPEMTEIDATSKGSIYHSGRIELTVADLETAPAGTLISVKVAHEGVEDILTRVTDREQGSRLAWLDSVHGGFITDLAMKSWASKGQVQLLRWGDR